MRKLVLSLSLFFFFFTKLDGQQKCKCIKQTQKFLFNSWLAKYWRKSCIISLCFRISLSINEMRKLMLVPSERVWDVTKTRVWIFFRENVNTLDIILIWESRSIYHFYYQIYLRYVSKLQTLSLFTVWILLDCFSLLEHINHVINAFPFTKVFILLQASLLKMFLIVTLLCFLSYF